MFDSSGPLTVVEICAGAGGQSLGLHRAGFGHQLAVEIDRHAAQTLRDNTSWRVAEGDVADREVWRPEDYVGVDLLAGGVPCPPFSIAGKQLGSSDERDLFAWAVEQVEVLQPRALLLENVRGLASERFAGYRQRVLDRLADLGYVADWRVLNASDHGLPQLRPRFVLVAMKDEDATYFDWPQVLPKPPSVGSLLKELMGSNGWEHAEEWAALADGIGPTLVGGSKKHGGADLGPTRAKMAWAKLFVDGKGIADAPPTQGSPRPTEQAPKLTIEMVSRLQGWTATDDWVFAGGKTSQYRQIGNAFPPPVAESIGRSIAAALHHQGEVRATARVDVEVHDPLYKALSLADDFVPLSTLQSALSQYSGDSVERRLSALARDFDVEIALTSDGPAYRLGQFKGFIGQSDHQRHEYLKKNRHRVS